MKKGLTEVERKDIFKKVLLDKTLREKFLSDPSSVTSAELSDDDKAAFSRMKAVLPVFDEALDSLSGVVLCSGGLNTR